MIYSLYALCFYAMLPVMAADSNAAPQQAAQFIPQQQPLMLQQPSTVSNVNQTYIPTQAASQQIQQQNMNPLQEASSQQIMPQSPILLQQPYTPQQLESNNPLSTNTTQNTQPTLLQDKNAVPQHSYIKQLTPQQSNVLIRRLIKNAMTSGGKTFAEAQADVKNAVDQIKPEDMEVALSKHKGHRYHNNSIGDKSISSEEKNDDTKNKQKSNKPSKPKKGKVVNKGNSKNHHNVKDNKECVGPDCKQPSEV